MGPESLGYLKPNISCFSARGTSFSTPVIAGIAAGIMQYDPELSSSEIIDIIESSGHLYPYGNNYLGYGVPDCERILQILKDTDPVTTVGQPIKIRTKKYIILASEVPFREVVAFHKKDSNYVIQQQIIKSVDGKFVIYRPDNTKFTTLAAKEYLLEIMWR